MPEVLRVGTEGKYGCVSQIVSPASAPESRKVGDGAGGEAINEEGNDIKGAKVKVTVDHGHMLINQTRLQEYILLCCQEDRGGLRDKPGK